MWPSPQLINQSLNHCLMEKKNPEIIEGLIELQSWVYCILTPLPLFVKVWDDSKWHWIHMILGIWMPLCSYWCFHCTRCHGDIIFSPTFSWELHSKFFCFLYLHVPNYSLQDCTRFYCCLLLHTFLLFLQSWEEEMGFENTKWLLSFSSQAVSFHV